MDGTPAPKILKDQLKRIPLIVRLKKVVWKFPELRSKQRRSVINLSRGYGQFASMKLRSCVDGKGNPIPWYTYPAIEYLDHLDFSDRTVFEFGSGNSSLWWAGRCKTLTSIEDDHEWYEKIKLVAKSIGNFDYRYSNEKSSYVEHDKIVGSDIVVVDGSHRPECAEYVLKQIKIGYLNPIFLVFDNSDWYPKTIAKLNRELNWIQVDFAGFGPINDYTWTTSIFINTTHASRPCYRHPLDSIAGILVDNLEPVI